MGRADGLQAATAPEAWARRDRDPFAAVLAFGSGAIRVGLAVGFAVATLSHGAFGGRALASPVAMRQWAELARQEVHGFLWAAYDVDMVKVKPEPPKPEPPKPEEKPDPQQPSPAAPKEAIPAAAPPPPPAQAGKVLTAPPDPNDAVDLTGNTFVQGEGKEYVGGVTAAAGTGSAATYNPAATVGGRPGGTGSGPAVAAPPKVEAGPDRSRAPGISGGSWSSCDFPPEADQDQVDYAVVVIVVTVRPDGSPMSVKVVNDPGHGFGRAARVCALSKRYTAGLDREGNPTVATTPPIHVTFTR